VIYSVSESPTDPDQFAIVRYAPGVTTVECDGFKSRRSADRIVATMNASYQSTAMKLEIPLNERRS